jgi:polysaccharide biosynthesis transport protein
MPAPLEDTSTQSGSIMATMRAVLHVFWSYRKWIFAPVLAVFLASFAYTQMVTPLYRGQAQILLESDAEGVEGLLARLSHPDLAKRIIADLGLQRRAEFDPLLKKMGIVHSLLVGMGLKPDPRTLTRQDRVQNAYFERLAIERVGSSRVVNVGFFSQDAELAASIANRIAEEALRAAPVADTAELARRLADAESRLAAARQANPSTTASPAAAAVEPSAATRGQQGDLQSRASMIREAVRLGRIAEMADVVNQEGVKKLLEQRAQVKGQITLDERSLPPTHPRMKEAYTQLNSIDSQLRMVADRVARGFENEARTLAARNGGVDTASRNATQGDSSAQQAREAQIATLEQEAQSLRSQIAAARAASGAGTTGETELATISGKIIARASAQKVPAYPDTPSLVLGNTLAALFASLSLVYVLHLLFRRPQQNDIAPATMPNVTGHAANADDAQDSARSFTWARSLKRPEGLGQPAAPPAINQNTPGTVLPGEGTPLPQPAHTPPPEVYHAAPSDMPAIRQEGSGVVAAEEISRELNDMGYLGRGKVSILYGMEREARTSLHAMRLGRRLVKEGSAIVVEIFGQDSLYSRVAGQNLAGLGAYLDGEASIAEVIHRDARSKLHILPAGEPLTYRIFGQTCQDQLEALVHILCQSYAHVIVDAGQVGNAGEMLSALADAIVIVTQQPQQSASLTKAVKRFESSGGSPVFVVLDEFKDVVLDQKANIPRIVGVVRG